MRLAATACSKALQDAGITAAEIDTIAVIRLFSDTVKTWASPFGGSNNPPESVAQHIDASPSSRIYSNAGGTEPLTLLRELCQDIASGEKTMALLTGAEAIANQRFALRNGFEVNWDEQFDVAMDNREYTRRFASPQELGSGMKLPVHYYALIENLQAHNLGHDTQQHRWHMAEMMAPFSEIASANPYAQFTTAYSAQRLAEIDRSNYAICTPYSKLLIAQDAVNQSAALLLTSAGNARRLGIDPQQWVFLKAYAEGADQCLTVREDPGSSEAMSQVLAATLDMAGLEATAIDLIDIYSCFPCAVQAACDALHLPTNGGRQLTVTGGLPYFGGPGNNYSMHALVEMARRLRGKAEMALVTANGGTLSKHAAAVLSCRQEAAQSVDWAKGEFVTVKPETIPARRYCDKPQTGRVLSYTVISRRDDNDLAVVLADTTSGDRFLASSTDACICSNMRQHSPVGREIQVQPGDKRHVFTW